MFRKRYIKSNLDTRYFNKWNTARNKVILMVICILWRSVILKFYRGKIGLPCETNEKAHRISGWTSDQPQMNSLQLNLEHLVKSGRQAQYTGDKPVFLSHPVPNALKGYYIYSQWKYCKFSSHLCLTGFDLLYWDYPSFLVELLCVIKSLSKSNSSKLIRKHLFGQEKKG